MKKYLLFIISLLLFVISGVFWFIWGREQMTAKVERKNIVADIEKYHQMNLECQEQFSSRINTVQSFTHDLLELQDEVDILLSEGYLNKAEAQLKAAQLKEAETKAQLEQNETKRILLEQTKRDQEEYQRLIEEAKKEAANSN